MGAYRIGCSCFWNHHACWRIVSYWFLGRALLDTAHLAGTQPRHKGQSGLAPLVQEDAVEVHAHLVRHRHHAPLQRVQPHLLRELVLRAGARENRCQLKSVWGSRRAV